jgi:hypothetical protein
MVTFFIRSLLTFPLSLSHLSLGSFMDSEDGQPDDICNGSLGREIMRAVQRNDTKPVKKVSIGRSPQIFGSSNSSTSELSDVLADMDDYLDEALEQDSGDEEPTPVSWIWKHSVKRVSHCS